MANRLSSAKALAICDHLLANGTSPKEFFHTFLQSKDKALAACRGRWVTDIGIGGTASLLPLLRDVFLDTAIGKKAWRQFVLEEAQVYVQDENMPSGYAPVGSYQSSGSIAEGFFDESEDELRHRRIQENMGFLYSLIYSKLNYHNNMRISKKEGLKTSLRASDSDEEKDEESGVSQHQDHLEDGHNLDINMVEDLLSIQPKGRDLDEHRLAEIPYTICSMVAFACNRRHNGLQMLNAVTFVACGVSDRVNDYLHSIGLTSSRDTSLDAFDTLKNNAERKLRLELSKAHVLRPFLCADNLDFQARVHSHRVEKSSRLFHGSWGYFHILPSALIPTPLRGAWSLPNFLESMRDGMSKTVNLKLFLATEEESQQWVSTIKAQLSHVLMEYLVKPHQDSSSKSKIKLKTSPPPVEKIEVYKPNILMLKLMDASDNSAEGVGQLIEQICKQINFNPEKFEEDLQVFEGDVGTCMNLESLRQKRHPSRNSPESLHNVLSVPGAAHTLWNFAEWIFKLHYGNEKDSHDIGAWRTWQSLGGKGDKKSAKKDFNTTMVMIQKVHTANLLFCLEHVISNGSFGTKVSEAETETLEELVNDCYQLFFTQQSISVSEKSGNTTAYNFRLRLRDLATVVEADNAQRAGDIGRLLLMWKRWSVMAQGTTGLSHYSKHLPRLVVLLTETLPSGLSHVIKHSMLLPTGNRDGHFVPKDFYLEQMNYLLKYFYNNSGNGTDIRQLTDRFSLNILLLRRLLQQLNLRSGKKIVLQNNRNPISETSMNGFRRMARDHLSLAAHPSRFPGEFKPQPVVNTYRSGAQRFQIYSLLAYEKKKASIFRWGYLPGPRERSVSREANKSSVTNPDSDSDNAHGFEGDGSDSEEGDEYL